jgi:hypothetical protein
MKAVLLLVSVALVGALSVSGKDDGNSKWAASTTAQVVANGKSNWLNRNDIDWEICHLNQVVGQSGIMNLALEDEDEGNKFTDHHAFLYRCDTGPNPFYLRYTKPTGGSVLLKIQWPTILDENYLFATKAEDRDHIGYGFRIAVCSSTNTRWHYRKFFFHSLRSLNRFVEATSTLMNGQHNVLHKADFFKAPRFDVPGINDGHNNDVNAYGDHFFGNEDTELLKAADQGQPEVPRDDALEDGNYVRNTVQQYPSN